MTWHVTSSLGILRHISIGLALGAVCQPVLAQRRVDPRNLQERVVVVVPVVGAGTYADPKRPLFAPLPGEKQKYGGIHEFSFQLSDDGQHAIAEFVARDREAFAAVLADRRVVKAFVKGQHKRDDIEKELRKHKKDFSLAPQEEKGRQ